MTCPFCGTEMKEKTIWFPRQVFLMMIDRRERLPVFSVPYPYHKIGCQKSFWTGGHSDAFFCEQCNRVIVDSSEVSMPVEEPRRD